MGTACDLENFVIKKILYLDMDNVLVDFPSAFARLPEATLSEYEDNEDEIPGIFALMDPMPGAVDAFNSLAEVFAVSLGKSIRMVG